MSARVIAKVESGIDAHEADFVLYLHHLEGLESVKRLSTLEVKRGSEEARIEISGVRASAFGWHVLYPF